jgi:hypothetical protein
MIKTICVLSLSGLMLTGCLSSGGGGGGNAGGGGNDGGQGAQPASFTTLVKDIFDGTSDTAEPVAINDLAVTYDDQEDEGAFDDLLGEP